MEYKQDTSINPCLLIGLGGTGVQVLKLLKKQFMEKSPELLAEGRGSVMFFALDTEGYNKAEKHDPLTAGEYQSMGIGVSPAEVVRRNIDSQADHGLKSVWPNGRDSEGSDNGLPYELPPDKTITMGASQNRLIGRVALFHESNTVFNKINQLIEGFFGLDTVQPDEKTPAQIHVIGSIAGGTGSSLILDVPYLIRLAAEKAGQPHVFVTGHFVTSGPFEAVLSGDTGQLERTASNTYTCLKELDYIYRTYALNQAAGVMTPLWEVKYAEGLGTVDAHGMPGKISKVPPMDWVNLYGKQNEEDISINDPDHTFDIIAQAISYNINGGINGKTLSNLDNILKKAKELTATGRAKPYASLGVSTLELPNETLTKFMAYHWARSLCNDKADNPNQYANADEDKDMWSLMMQWELEKLQEIVLPGCPVYRSNSAGVWEKIEGDREIKQNWTKLAEAYGVPKPKFRHRDDIVEGVLNNYSDKNVRLREAGTFISRGDRMYNDYSDQIKKDLPEKIGEIKNRLDETLSGLGDYAFKRKSEKFGDEPILRSTDAYSKSIDDLVKGISKIIDQVGLELQNALKRQHSSEQEGNPQVLEESKFSLLGVGARRGQVTGWAEAAKLGIDSKAQAAQARFLKSALEEIREYLGSVIQANVEKADDELTEFVKRAKNKADKVQSEMKRTESEKAVSVFLIQAEEFDSFVAQRADALRKRSVSIWDRTTELIREKPPARCEPTLIDTLSHGRAKVSLGQKELKIEKSKLGCLERACLEAAEQEMEELKFKEFVEETFIDQGEDDIFRQQLAKLFKKAGAWFDEDVNKRSTGSDDNISKIDFLLYPPGAEDIRQIIDEMNERNEFKCSNLIIWPMPEATRQEGIVKISMRFGYSLESYDPFDEHKRNEMNLLKSRPNERRSILKDYDELPCPSEAYAGGGITMVTLGSNEFDEAANAFIMAHNYNLLEERVAAGKSTWIFNIKDYVSGTDFRELPGKKVKVKLALKPDPNSTFDQRFLQKLYLDTKDAEVSILKLGAAIMNQEDLVKAITEAESAHRQQLREQPEHSDKIDRELDVICLKSYLDGRKIREVEASGRKSASSEADFIRQVIRLQIQ